MTPPAGPPGRDAARDATDRAYARFLGRAPGKTDAFYAEERVRFELRDDDVLAVPEGTRVGDGPSGPTLVNDRVPARVELDAVPRADAERLLSMIDGRRSVATLRASAPAALDAFAKCAFGRLVFAPFAVMALEEQLSACEIVRYPGSPYEIVRTYWENMIEVARAIIEGESAVNDPARFRWFLGELHRTALLGRQEESFYRPASPIVQKRGVMPGRFIDEPTLLDETDPEIRFVSGTRIGARPLGARYQDLLAASVDDPASRLGDRTFTSDRGTPWGRLVTARGEGDLEAAPWFCPPRPITEEHWEKLRTSLCEATGASRNDEAPRVIRALACFHQSFLRVHPFAAGNQSVVMSLVNHVLRSSHGAGIPHLVLDHLSFRLSEDAYAKVFARAVEEWLVFSESPAARSRTLSGRKRTLFQFLEDLERTGSHEAADELRRRRPEAARLALLGAD